MSAETVSAVAAVASAIVSIVAVAAAYRSASSAEKSATTAVAALHRAAIQELVTLCHEVLAEEFRANRIVSDYRSELNALAVFSGSDGGSAQMKLLTSLENNLSTVHTLVSEAKAIVENHTKLFAASAQDLDQMSSRLGLSRVQLVAIREQLENQLSEMQSQNHLYREKLING